MAAMEIHVKPLEDHYLAVQGAKPVCTEFRITVFDRLSTWAAKVTSDDVEDFRIIYRHSESKEAYFAKVVDALMTDESELTKPKFYTTMKLPTEGTEPAPMITIGIIDRDNNDMKLKMAVFKLAPETDSSVWHQIMQTMISDRKRCESLLAEESRTVVRQKDILSTAYADVIKLTAEHVAYKNDLLVAFAEVLDNKSDRIAELEGLLKQEKQRVATAQSVPNYPASILSQSVDATQPAIVGPDMDASLFTKRFPDEPQSMAMARSQSQSQMAPPPRMRAGKGLKRRHPVTTPSVNQKPKLSPAKPPPSLFGDSQEEL